MFRRAAASVLPFGEASVQVLSPGLYRVDNTIIGINITLINPAGVGIKVTPSAIPMNKPGCVSAKSKCFQPENFRQVFVMNRQGRLHT